MTSSEINAISKGKQAPTVVVRRHSDPIKSEGQSNVAQLWSRYKKRFLIVLGPFLMIGIWYLLGLLIASNARLLAFVDMAPQYAIPQLIEGILDGSVIFHAGASLMRVGQGLFFALLVGGMLGVVNGILPTLRYLTHIPFQIIRMVSPLSWMPVAVLLFAGWHSAIVFLITMASIWPIYYALTGSFRRLNPDWFALAASLRASRWQTIRYFILPAIAPDLVQGVRLALGVAWIVLVPAELLGVNSGLGFAINDARDTLSYDRLAAIILAIGILGLVLDTIMAFLSEKVAWKSDG